MSWEPFSLHFKQSYEGGYRYLDECGEFMLQVEEKLNLMPEEIKPSGCKMRLPESGISVGVDAAEVNVVQEFHRDNGVEFIKICQVLVDIANDIFKPRHVESNVFAAKNFWSFPSSGTAQEASLRITTGFSKDLALIVDMPPNQENIDCTFVSGSVNFHVQVKPISFQSMTLQKFTQPPMCSKSQRLRVERLNKAVNRFNSGLQYGMMMELDLFEFDPAVGPLKTHFRLLQEKEEKLKARFAIK